MQNQHYIDIERQREFSEIISDSLGILRQTWKVQLRLALIYLGPLILLAAALNTYQSMNTLNSLSSLFSDPSTQNLQEFQSNNGADFSLSIVTSAFQLFAIWMVMTVALCVVRQYRDGAGVIDPTLVAQQFRRVVVPMSLSMIVVAAITVVSVIGAIIGSFIASIFLVLQPAVIVFEEHSVLQSVNRSFELVRHSWWFTCGVVIVLGLLQYILVYAFTLIPTVLFFTLHVLGITNANPILEAISALFLALGSAAGMLMFIAFGTSLAVLWGHHRERIDSYTLEDRIGRIGTPE